MMQQSVIERLMSLQKYLADHQLSAMLITMSDPHGSEYPGDADRWIRFLTGFSGSAGTLIVFADGKRCFWTDGRYHIQADRQLAGTGIRVYKEGLDAVPAPAAFLAQELKDGDVLALPADYLNAEYFSRMSDEILEQAAYSNKRIAIREVSLNDEECFRLWPNRPKRRQSTAWVLTDDQACAKVETKIRDLRHLLRVKTIDHYIVSSLDAIAWLLNLRGSDIDYTPVLYAYLIVSRNEANLYLQTESAQTLSAEGMDMLVRSGIKLSDYSSFYNDLETLSGNIAIDRSFVTRKTEDICARIGKVIPVSNATLIPQSIKNPLQIRKIHQAHLMDGVALTKLIYELKKKDAQELTQMSESDVAERLEEYKSVNSSYLGPSFETIAAYADNAAIVHYTPQRGADKKLAPEGFLLLDCGGQYLEGTTDVTRTIALGTLTHEQKVYYTAVLKGHLRLMKSSLDPQTPTRKLDKLAREPLWELGADYLHGTGHGVGFMLSVHEGPVRIISARNKEIPDRPLLRGQVVSDEPGYYREGAFGIRIENLLAVERSAGRRFYFDPLTAVPYEREAIIAEHLSDLEKQWLNDYHRHVYERLSPHLSKDVRAWLKEQTQPI